MNNFSPQDKLLRVNTVADRLGISGRTVYRLIESGALPAVRISTKIIRVSTSELEKFIKKRTLI